MSDVSPEAERRCITARLNARVQPMDRGTYFEDPLNETLQHANLGEVTGGGTQLADEPAGIEYCDLEIVVPSLSDEVLRMITSRLEELGAPKGSKLIVSDGADIPFGVTEGLALFLNGVDLPDEVYANSDVDYLIEECNKLMMPDGLFRGHWQGSKETGLYFYGRSFAKMRSAIEPLLASYPLCQKSRTEQIA